MEETRYFLTKGDAELSKEFADEVALTPGERLKDILAERHISQQQLADCTGLSAGTISNIINSDDMHQPKAGTLVTIASYLDISVDWLLGLTSMNNKTTDELIKQISEKTGYSDKAVMTFMDSVDYHEHGYDYKYGNILGFILDKSYKDTKSFIYWLEMAKVEAYLYRNNMSKNSEIIWRNEENIFDGTDRIDFYIKKAMDKIQMLVQEYIHEELCKSPDKDYRDDQDQFEEDCEEDE